MVQENVASRRIVVFVGATASGKSAAAIALARKLPLEIVNCDASQVYSGMCVGTARPSEQEMQGVPHHLYGVVAPDDPVNAGRYVEMADRVVSEVWSRGRVPLFVGGTGLYVRALLRGLARIPDIDPGVRERLLGRVAREGAEALHRELSEVDPEAARRIAPGDPQRITRALEVYEQTGRTITSYQVDHRFGQARYDALLLGVLWSAGELRERIVRRVPELFDRGFAEEVALLASRGHDFSARAFKALGYQDVLLFVRGEIPRAEAVARVTGSHLRYAKRQSTWFKKEPGIHWFREDELPSVVSRVRDFVGEQRPGV